MSDININIDIMDYVTTGQIEEAILEGIKDKAGELFRNERRMQTLISNQAYYIVAKILKEHYDKSLEEVLKEKVTAIILDLSSYTLLTAYDENGNNKPSNYREYMDSCLEGFKPLINDKLKELIVKRIEDYEDRRDLVDLFEKQVRRLLEEALFTKREEQDRLYEERPIPKWQEDK